MSEYVDFHYMPLEGRITGKQVLQQTEDAINDLGNKVYNLDVDEERIDEAIENSEQAINTANSALAAVTTDRAVWKNTVAEMKETDIDLGVTAVTRGKLAFNDGSGAFYGVRSEKGGDVDSDDTVFLDNGNVAERIKSMNIIAYGNNIIFVSNVAELIDSDALVGSVYGTAGYYSANDGGAGLYYIRTKTPSDVEDGGSIFFLDNGNVAELIHDGTVNVKQFGAYGDGGSVNPHDDTDKFMAMCNAAIAHGYTDIVIPYGEYLITENCMFFDSVDNVTIHGNNAILQDNSPFPHDGGYTKSGAISFLTCNNVHVQDLQIVSDTKKGQSGIIFISCTNFSAKNIFIQNIYRFGILLCPAFEYGNGICSNFVLEDITIDHTGSHGVFHSIINNSSIPAGAQYIITNGTMRNVRVSYAGTQIGDAYASDKWTAGIDFGELLQRLENVTFVGCLTEYAIESGFHCEGGVKLVNVKFIGCSACDNAKKDGGASFGGGWTMPYGAVLSGCRTKGNKQPILLVGTPSYDVVNNTMYDVVDSDAGRIVFDNNIPMFVEDNDGELFSNAGLLKNNGLKYVDNSSKNMVNTYVDVKSDNGNRYIQKSGLTTNAFACAVGDIVEVSGTYQCEATADSTVNPFNMRFVSYDNNKDPVQIGDGGVGAFKPFDVSRFPADVKEIPIHFRILENITSLGTNVKYLALQFSAMSARILNLGIRKVNTIFGENVIADDIDCATGKYLINPAASMYYGGMNKASTSSRFVVARYNNENWLVRRNNDNTSTDVSFGTFPYNTNNCNVEVTLLVVCASSTNNVTSKININNLANGTGSTAQTITVSDTIQRQTFTFDLDALNSKVFAVRISETGVGESSPAIYYRVESIKVVPKS